MGSDYGVLAQNSIVRVSLCKIDNQINPLDDSKEIVLNLSNLYQFKKEIELDNTKEEIYNRLSEIFMNQFKISNFSFVEIDVSKQKISLRSLATLS